MTGPDARSGGTTRRFALLALIAAELLMSFSFFGYFHVEPISVTTAYLPVLLAGALTGPPEAAAVGAVFGLASMWKASASYVMAADQLFSPFLSGDPLGSLVLSVGSRTLFGLAAGLLYLAARHLRRPWIGVAAVSFFGRTIHSLMVYSTMGLFFPEAGYGPANALGGLLSPMDLLFNLTTAGVVLAFWRAAGSRLWQRFQSRVELSRTPRSGEEYHRLSLAVAIVVTLVSALAVTFYFMHRIDYVLEVNGIELTDTGYADVLHLQMQFLFGILSLMVLVVLFLILNRRYTSSYMALEGKLDSLTGVMTRKAFFAACSGRCGLCGRRTVRRPASSWWIWTTSRRSTTPTATPRGTGRCGRRPGACGRSSAGRASSAAWAATNSPCWCARTSRMRSWRWRCAAFGSVCTGSSGRTAG